VHEAHGHAINLLFVATKQLLECRDVLVLRSRDQNIVRQSGIRPTGDVVRVSS
jgi:hypothetical protein